MQITRPRGTNDFLPVDTAKWHYVEAIIRSVCRDYGYGEIRLPIFENTELFQRGVGETTDIVSKEMYTFTDRGDRSITLRPEGTASTVRAYLEHKMSALPQPNKLYYMGPMFRYERPQAGRYRQFHQFGVEVFGSRDPAIDAEVINLAMEIYSRLGLRDLEVHLNSIGCPKCRADHRAALEAFLAEKLDDLCGDCRDRFSKNPLRILDCKNPRCQTATKGAPTTMTCLCDECQDHFTKVKCYLDAAGTNYVINPRLVRGLDYYTKTAFEIIVQGIGAQGAICGGGRYDGLVASLGGPDTPGVGFALGMERIFPTLETQGITIEPEDKLDVFIIALGDAAREQAFRLLTDLRHRELKCEMDYLGRSMKSQIKAADKAGARVCLILGDDELSRGVAMLRTMADSQQREVPLEQAAEAVRACLAE